MTLNKEKISRYEKIKSRKINCEVREDIKEGFINLAKKRGLSQKQTLQEILEPILEKEGLI